MSHNAVSSGGQACESELMDGICNKAFAFDENFECGRYLNSCASKPSACQCDSTESTGTNSNDLLCSINTNDPTLVRCTSADPYGHCSASRETNNNFPAKIGHHQTMSQQGACKTSADAAGAERSGAERLGADRFGAARFGAANGGLESPATDRSAADGAGLTARLQPVGAEKKSLEKSGAPKRLDKPDKNGLSACEDHHVVPCLAEQPHKLGMPSRPLLSAFKGILLAFLSSVFFSFTTVIVKYLDQVDAGQMAFVRFSGMLLFSFPLLMDSNQQWLGPAGSRHWVLLRGLAGASSLYLRYSALHYLPISNATVIVLSMPVFVCIFGRLFLKEACGVFHVIALAVTLVGIAFTSKLDVIFGSSDKEALEKGIDRQGELYGLVSGLAAALVGSSAYIMVRKVKHLHYSVILFNFSWVALLESTVITYTVHSGLRLPAGQYTPWLLVCLG